MSVAWCYTLVKPRIADSDNHDMDNANRRLRFVIDIVGEHDLGDAVAVQQSLRDVIRAEVSQAVVVRELPSHYHGPNCELCTSVDPPEERDV